MTPKKMLVVNINEIKTIDLRCKCGTVLTVPATTQRLSRNLDCANCGAHIWQDGSHIQVAAFYLIQGVRGLTENPTEQLSVTFTVEENSN